MSSRKSPNKINYPFNEVWNRIRSITPLKRQNELSKIVGTSQSNISKRSSENIFPPEWAFRIAQKYALNTDWIMTGKGQKRIVSSEVEYQNKILGEIDTWLTDLIKKEPFRKEWFKGVFLDSFPKFEKYRISQGSQSKDNTNRNSKAA